MITHVDSTNPSYHVIITALYLCGSSSQKHTAQSNQKIKGRSTKYPTSIAQNCQDHQTQEKYKELSQLKGG